MIGQLATGGRARRVDYRVPVEILCSKGIRLNGKTRNVSEGGMFVETALLLPVGSPVRCGLALQHSSVEVLGRIAWSRPKQAWNTAGMGIQFVGFEEVARRLLHEVVETGEAVPQAIDPEDTARLRRAPRNRMVLAAVFAGVATATAGVVMALLPSSEAAGASPARTKLVPAALIAAPLATAATVDSEDAPAAEGDDAVGQVAIVPRKDGTTAVFIPIEQGSQVEVRHYPLADPDGVALFLEGGSTSAELTTIRHPQGTVQAVWVGARGTELRLFTRGAPPPYRVDRFERTLRVLFESGATELSR